MNRFARFALASLFALLAVVIGCALLLTEGKLVYSLDDAYIHLAVAEEILRGNFGINRGEPASPSSSIIFPYLVSALLAIGAQDLAPLTINIVASVGTVLCISALFRELDIPFDRLPTPALIAVALGLTLCMNLVGLALTGLEHSLQLLSTLLALLGLLRFSRTANPEWWWLTCLALQPTIRFEGAAVTLAGLVVLGVAKQWRAALAVFGVSAVVLGAYALRMSSLGLPLLPSSVLIKAPGLAAGQFGKFGTLFFDVLVQLMATLFTRPGLILLLLFLVFLVVFRGAAATRSDASSPHQLRVANVSLFCLIVVGAHLAMGRTGAFHRYEAYAVYLGALGLTAVYRDQLVQVLASTTERLTILFVGLVFCIFSPYATATLATPIGSSNIFDQQYQMHRFVTEFYRGRVAVNDLGWVSYRNDLYVLDLYGLGSEDARKANLTERDVVWMERLARQNRVDLAMMYENWFPEGVPANWVLLGKLTLLSKRVTADSSSVSFFATDAAAVPALLQQLRGFVPTLPPRAAFTFSQAANREQRYSGG